MEEGAPSGPAAMGGVRALWADGVVTGEGDALRDAAVVVTEDGTVLDVGPAASVLPRHGGVAVDQVRGVLLPGLVNAHCHVELSALHGQVPGGAGFVPWVERLIGARVEGAPEDDAAAIERAVGELSAFGTAAIGEVTNSLAAVGALARARLAGCVFHEVFGVAREAAMRRLEALEREVEARVGAWPSTDLAYAPTPHTLYTTHPDAVRSLLAQGRARRARMSLHLAEHAAERRALAHGDGPVVEWYARRLRLPQGTFAPPRVGPVALADELGALGSDVLLVHLTDARPGELATIAERGAPVVLCPRSNLHIEARLPPLLAMRAAGIAPALGTDSLASNASLDVLAEARALGDGFPSLPARELLTMATWNGARALGRVDLGRIARGARPGLLLVDCAVAEGADPAARVLEQARAKRRWAVAR